MRGGRKYQIRPANLADHLIGKKYTFQCPFCTKGKVKDPAGRFFLKCRDCQGSQFLVACFK